MEISLNEQIAEADQKIAEAESRLTRFDAAFDEVAAEETSAGEHSWRAAVAVTAAQDERDKIKERLDTEMAKRHDLQVHPSTRRKVIGLIFIFRLKNAKSMNMSKQQNREYKTPSKRSMMKLAVSLM